MELWNTKPDDELGFLETSVPSQLSQPQRGALAKQKVLGIRGDLASSVLARCYVA